MRTKLCFIFNHEDQFEQISSNKCYLEDFGSFEDGFE